MIKGMHGLFYTPEPEALRAFLRDVLQFPFTDTGGGWLIFEMPSADLGVHPAGKVFHELSFYCDDIQATIAELKGRGAEFAGEVEEEDWGFHTIIRAPGGLDVLLYQPKYSK
jgi:hypothetical protein